MPDHAEAEERPGHCFGEKDAPDPGWDVGKGIPHTPDDEVLEKRSLLHEGRLVLAASKIPLANERNGQSDHFSRFPSPFRGSLLSARCICTRVTQRDTAWVIKATYTETATLAAHRAVFQIARRTRSAAVPAAHRIRRSPNTTRDRATWFASFWNPQQWPSLSSAGK